MVAVSTWCTILLHGLMPTGRHHLGNDVIIDTLFVARLHLSCLPLVFWIRAIMAYRIRFLLLLGGRCHLSASVVNDLRVCLARVIADPCDLDMATALVGLSRATRSLLRGMLVTLTLLSIHAIFVDTI